MSQGQTIVVSSNPKGVFLEGVITDTSKPGTPMELVPGAANKSNLKSGRPQWRAAASAGADGAPLLIAILLEDYLQGKTITDAYVANTRCFLYCPAAGEDINVLVGEGAGTANSFNVGDKLMIDADAGVFIPISGSPASVPFVVMEGVLQVVGSSLVWCKCTGH